MTKLREVEFSTPRICWLNKWSFKINILQLQCGMLQTCKNPNMPHSFHMHSSRYRGANLHSLLPISIELPCQQNKESLVNWGWIQREKTNNLKWCTNTHCREIWLAVDWHPHFFSFSFFSFSSPLKNVLWNLFVILPKIKHHAVWCSLEKFMPMLSGISLDQRIKMTPKLGNHGTITVFEVNVQLKTEGGMGEETHY